MSSTPWASYFRADHLILHPLVFFLCRPYNSPSVHRFGELFLCHPSLGRVFFVPTIQLSYLSIPWRVIFVSSIPWESYFRADHLILRPLASYFRADHITLHPSILLASYFCAVLPLGELFSCHPSLGRVIFVPII